MTHYPRVNNVYVQTKKKQNNILHRFNVFILFDDRVPVLRCNKQKPFACLGKIKKRFRFRHSFGESPPPHTLTPQPTCISPDDDDLVSNNHSTIENVLLLSSSILGPLHPSPSTTQSIFLRIP